MGAYSSQWLSPLQATWKGGCGSFETWKAAHNQQLCQQPQRMSCVRDRGRHHMMCGSFAVAEKRTFESSALQILGESK